MNFRIADTFTDSLTKLTGDEQKVVKITTFDLQMNPVNPGMKFHRPNGARDPNFWSVRANRDIRLIVHRTADRAAWDTLNSDTSRHFDKPKPGRIAVKVINHPGDEVMKVFRVNC
jgi:hypothetical protein